MVNGVTMIGINVNSKHHAFADMIVRGVKTIETRECTSLHPYIGKRVAIVETGKGKAKVLGSVLVTGCEWVGDASAFDAYADMHRVERDSEYYISSKGKYLYFLADAEKYDGRDFIVGKGIVARNVEEVKA